MSKTEPEALQNAEQIIERFGGIRPMASKINVAVTTIQGWKKRGVIPARRRDEILSAADKHDIDLSDLMASAENDNAAQTQETATKEPETEPTEPLELEEKAAPEPAKTPEKPAAKQTPPPEPAQPQPKTSTPITGANPPKQDPESVKQIEKLVKDETRAVRRASWMTAAIVAAGIGAVALLLWPQTEKAERRLSAIEKNVNDVKNEVTEIKNNGSFFGNLIPADLEQRIASLQEQAGQAQQQVGEALKQAEQISNDVMGQDAGTIEQRIAKLEEHASVFSAASPELTNMLGRLKSLQSSLQGQAQLDQSVEELNTLIGNVYSNVGNIDAAVEDGPEQSETGMETLLHSSLITAKEQSDTLGKTFEGVPPEKMKAAAVLLGFSQFRSALNRDNESFADDLKLLSSLLGDDKSELQTEIQQLAPYAESGVLSPAGLSEEFRTVAGDMVIASLQGEDVSMEDKAKAHFNELFTVEKNGEMVSGSPVQQKVATAQALLDEGKVDEAVAILQSMDGEAGQISQPFIERAQKTMMAQQLKNKMIDALNLRATDMQQIEQGNITPENIKSMMNSVGQSIGNSAGNALKTKTYP